MKFLLLLLISMSIYASDISWITSYKEAIQKAQSEDKHILVFMSKEGCKSCQFMNEKVFVDEAVSNYINKNYIALHLDIHDNDAPKSLQVSVTPVFHFLTSKGEKFKETLYGGKTAPFFIKTIHID
ncbi:MAG: hypothetical protein COA44_15150 [Arcobacter sp.]|nr:MAG: hypothetical protein COA44_15150 [Arcobacter sp.]